MNTPETYAADDQIRYTKAQAAEKLGISVRKLDELRTDGKIIGRLDGARVYFDRSELVSYAKSCPAEGAA